MMPWMTKQASTGAPAPFDVYRALRMQGAPKEVAEAVGKQWMDYVHMQKHIASLPPGSPEAAMLQDQAEMMRKQMFDAASPYVQGNAAGKGKGGLVRSTKAAPAVKNELALRGGPAAPTNADMWRQAVRGNAGGVSDFAAAAARGAGSGPVPTPAPTPKPAPAISPELTRAAWNNAVKEPGRMYGKIVEKAMGNASNTPAVKKGLINAAKGAVRKHPVLAGLAGLATLGGGGALYAGLGGSDDAAEAGADTPTPDAPSQVSMPTEAGSSVPAPVTPATNSAPASSSSAPAAPETGSIDWSSYALPMSIGGLLGAGAGSLLGDSDDEEEEYDQDGRRIKKKKGLFDRTTGALLGGAAGAGLGALYKNIYE